MLTRHLNFFSSADCRQARNAAFINSLCLLVTLRLGISAINCFTVTFLDFILFTYLKQMAATPNNNVLSIPAHLEPSTFP